MRALRLLSARMPHLPVLGPGDGHAARAHLPDEGSLRRPPAAVGHSGAALRSLPGLPGLRERLPIGREIRRADRADPRRDRGRARAFALGPAVSRPAVCALPLPRPAARARAAAVAVRGLRAALAAAGERRAAALARAPAPAGGAGPQPLV